MAAFIKLSAFADEISPDPVEQFDLLARCKVRHVELRSAWKTNVLDLSEEQISTIEKLLKERGMALSAIGSPIGKVKITDPWEPHWKRFQRAVELAKRFNTPNIRIFSYYPADDGKPWSDHRPAVLDRMQQKVEYAEKAGVRLVHENESRIYGEDPVRVLDLFRSIDSPAFKAVYDAANYVHGGYEPLNAWHMTKSFTTHLHIKDWIHGQEKGVLAGTGQGRIPESLADAWQLGYEGFATLEPHLLGGGPTGGITGPELFPNAIEALVKILNQLGYPHDAR
ncbi:MAG: sugar phosphate isomerase/epimerase [Planctomycetia bacterium]|nr:sugar phosphate isomerase/epimerase [Planctomycetia bacterium]